MTDYTGSDTEVIIPEVVEYNGQFYTVTDIYEGGPYDWGNLIKITIPFSVTYLGDATFDGASNLQIVILKSETPPMQYNAFDNCHENLKIYVPNESVSLYQSEWEDYAKIIDSIDNIPASASEMVENIVEEVILPSKKEN